MFSTFWDLFVQYTFLIPTTALVYDSTSVVWRLRRMTATTRTATTRKSYIQDFPLPIGRSFGSRRYNHIFIISLSPQGVHRVHTSLLRFSYLGRGYSRKRWECERKIRIFGSLLRKGVKIILWGVPSFIFRRVPNYLCRSYLISFFPREWV